MIHLVYTREFSCSSKTKEIGDGKTYQGWGGDKSFTLQRNFSVKQF